MPTPFTAAQASMASRTEEVIAALLDLRKCEAERSEKLCRWIVAAREHLDTVLENALFEAFIRTASDDEIDRVCQTIFNQYGWPTTQA